MLVAKHFVIYIGSAQKASISREQERIQSFSCSPKYDEPRVHAQDCGFRPQQDICAQQASPSADSQTKGQEP